MNKIRTTAITAAIAGGSILGLVGVTGIADAAVSTDDASVAAVGDDVEVDNTDRAERRALRQEARQEKRQEIADLLGVSVEELAEQIGEGATLADVAEANGVEVSAVVDLIVENKTERIDAAVESGRLTAEEAAEKTADLEERVQTRVEEGRADRGDGEGRGGERGGADADAEG